MFLYYAGSLKLAGTLVIIIGRNITRLTRLGCLLVQDFALIMHGLFPGRKAVRNGVSALFIKNSNTMKLLGDKKQNRLATVKRDSALAKKANGLFAY